MNSSISGLCMTKLDVLDGLETIRICIGYEIDGEAIEGFPLIADRIGACKPVYEDMAGWNESTVGATEYAELPLNARNYLARIEALAGIPLDIISTGPGREQTIVRQNPFD